MNYKIIPIVLLFVFLFEVLESSSVFVRTSLPLVPKDGGFKVATVHKNARPDTDRFRPLPGDLIASLSLSMSSPLAGTQEDEEGEDVGATVHTAILASSSYIFSSFFLHNVCPHQATLRSTDLLSPVQRPPIPQV